MEGQWTHAICLTDYQEKFPGRTPHRMGPADLEKCCYCGEDTLDGIYVRDDPKKLHPLAKTYDVVRTGFHREHNGMVHIFEVVEDGKGTGRWISVVGVEGDFKPLGRYKVTIEAE